MRNVTFRLNAPFAEQKERKKTSEKTSADPWTKRPWRRWSKTLVDGKVLVEARTENTKKDVAAGHLWQDSAELTGTVVAATSDDKRFSIIC